MGRQDLPPVGRRAALHVKLKDLVNDMVSASTQFNSDLVVHTMPDETNPLAEVYHRCRQELVTEQLENVRGRGGRRAKKLEPPQRPQYMRYLHMINMPTDVPPPFQK